MTVKDKDDYSLQDAIADAVKQVHGTLLERPGTVPAAMLFVYWMHQPISPDRQNAGAG